MNLYSVYFIIVKKQQYFANDMSISKNLKRSGAVEEEDYSSEKETQTYLIYTRDIGSQTEEDH